MIFGILFPQWPNQREWDKLPWNGKAQWLLLGGLQATGIAVGGMTLLYA